MIETKLLEREIYTVSALNREARLLLDSSFPPIWVEGEISNLRQPGSGHIYFTLKDEMAQVRCAMFRMRCHALTFTPKDGMHVLARAKISLYEERGDFQLVVDCMEEAGDGALRRAFDALKQRLEIEGLFASAHKKPLPTLPHCVGIVTSPTGAAVRDILSVLKRRFPSLPVIIYPTQVQGSEAADQIVKAIQLANLRKECDVLIVARGGGSLEDLWPFNEERVARAIYASQIPIVTGIGHEIDFTIADFVADQRAPTPSAAAELISPNLENYLQNMQQLQSRLTHLIIAQLQHIQLKVTHAKQRLQSPQQKLQQHAQRLDDLEQRLRLANSHYLKHLQGELRHAFTTLQRITPLFHIKEHQTQTANLEQRLSASLHFQFNNAEQRLNNVMRALDTVSPLNTLQRGYSIITHNTQIVKKANTVTLGEKIKAHLAEGELECTVTSVKLDINKREIL